MTATAIATLKAAWAEADPYEQYVSTLDSLVNPLDAWTAGADGAGVDVTIYGATSGSLMQWDASDDRLEFTASRVKMGTLSSTVAGSGVTVTSSNNIVVEVHADDGDEALGSAVTARAIDGRFMNYGSPAAETWGIQGKCKISTLARTANVAAGVVGAFESTGTCSLATGSGNTFITGVMGRLGLAANMTLGAGTFACGVLSFYNTAAASDPTGEYTVAFMATASDIAGTGDWDYGVYIEDADKQFYGTTAPTGAAAVNSFDIVVDDACTQSSGYAHALHIGLTNSGAKTGAASASQMNGLGIDYTQSGTFTGGINGIYVYIDDSGAPTLTSAQVVGVYVDLQEMGQATTMACLALDKTNTTAGSYADCFIHMVNQGSGGTTNAFQFHGALATNFIQSAQANNFFTTGSVGGSQSHKLKCIFGGTTYYIPLNTA